MNVQTMSPLARKVYAKYLDNLDNVYAALEMTRKQAAASRRVAKLSRKRVARLEMVK